MSTLKQRNILTTFGYIRRYSKQFAINIPDDIIQIVIIFYGKTFKALIKGLDVDNKSYIQLTQLSNLLESPQDIYYSGRKRILVKSKKIIYKAHQNYDKENEPFTLKPVEFPEMDDNDYINIISKGPDTYHTIFVSATSKTIYGAGDRGSYQLFGYTEGKNKFSANDLSIIPLSPQIFKTDPIIKIQCGKLFNSYSLFIYFLLK